jgi:hypothetical protein
MNMASKLLAQDLMLVFHNEQPPSEGEWSRFIEEMRAQTLATRRIPSVVVLSLGGAPTATQRALSKERVSALGDGSERIAVLTASALVRGAVTALRWIIRQNFCAFSFTQLTAALTYVGATQSSDIVRRELTALAARCGVSTLPRLS